MNTFNLILPSEDSQNIQSHKKQGRLKLGC